MARTEAAARRSGTRERLLGAARSIFAGKGEHQSAWPPQEMPDQSPYGRAPGLSDRDRTLLMLTGSRGLSPLTTAANG